MGQLDASIVTLALPSIRSDLHASLGSVEWVSLSYLLVLVGSVSAMGRLADVLGRKLLYIYGFALFTLASVGCGLAPSLSVLLALRVLQAVGAALLQANSVALIRTTVAAHQLNRAIGLQGAAQALGLALGPAAGGSLIAVAGWRWVFWVNLPAGLIGIVLGVLLLPRTRIRAARTRFDWPGLALLLPSVAILLLGLSILDRQVGYGLDLLALAVAGLIGFGFVERGRPAPLVALSLFSRDTPFSVAISSGMLGYLVLFGALFVCPLLLAPGLTGAAGSAGLLITILPLSLALSAPLAGRITERFAPAVATVGGLSLAASGFLIAAIGGDQRAGLIAMLVLAGAGLGLFIPVNNAAVARAGRPDQAGAVSGLLNMSRGIGTALGVAVAGTTFTLGGAGTSGFRWTMALFAALAVTAALLNGGRRLCVGPIERCSPARLGDTAEGLAANRLTD